MMSNEAVRITNKRPREKRNRLSLMLEMEY